MDEDPFLPGIKPYKEDKWCPHCTVKNGFLVLNPLIGNKSLLIVQEVESK